MGIEEDFYATIKFKSGEEVFAKVAASEEEDRTMLIVSNPIIVQEIKSRDGKIVAIVSKGDETVASIANHVIEIPNVSQCLTPILATIPLQLLSYYIAIIRGCDVDQPRNLAKSVTVE